MTQRTSTFTSNGSFALPSNLVPGKPITAYLQGGNSGNGTNGAYVSVPVQAASFPLTVVVGLAASGPLGLGSAYNGGNGFSGGAGGGHGVSGTINFGYGGGGSSAILDSSSVLLSEAGGADGINYVMTINDTGLGGGSGGGYASNAGGSESGHAGGNDGGGSGGSQGGTGGAGAGGSTGGTGHGGGTNGNAASGGAGGAGVGSGGLAVAGTASCYVDTGVLGNTYQYGNGDGSGGRVVFTYNTVDAPPAPSVDVPTPGEVLDGQNQGLTVVGTYKAPSADTGSLEAVRLLIITGGVTKWWNGSALVSSPANAPLTIANGLGAVNGQEFEIPIPAGILTDGTTYQASLQTIESNAGLISPSASPVSFTSVQGPTVTATAPASGAFVNTLTPVISWSDVVPSGNQTGVRVVLYPASSAPTAPPSTTDATAIWDSGFQTGTTGIWNLAGNGGHVGGQVTVPFTLTGSTLPLQSIEEYIAFIQIETTGGLFSNWAEVPFTVQLTPLAPPTLAAVPSTEPTSGMPATKLTMTARDNLVPPQISTRYGLLNTSLLNPVQLVNCSASIEGPPMTNFWSPAGQPFPFSLSLKAVANGTMSAGVAVLEAPVGFQSYAQILALTKVTGRTITFTVNWYNAFGTFLNNSVISNSTADTTGGISIAGIVGAPPAGASYGILNVSYAGCTAGEIHDIAAVAWNFGPAATQWYAGIGAIGSAAVTAVAESVEFQADYVGNGSWEDVLTTASPPASTPVIGLNTGSTCVDYDMGAPFNLASVSYRCRNLVTISGYSISGVAMPEQVLASPWSNTVAVTGPASTYWWALPPSDPTMAMQLARLRAVGTIGSGSSLASPITPPTPQGLNTSIALDKQEQLGIFRPFGKTTAILVHGDIWEKEFDLSLYLRSPAEYAALEAIRDLQDTVLLKSDMENAIYWVGLGPDFNRGIMQRAGRQQSPTSGLTVHCTPVDPYDVDVVSQVTG